MAPLILVAESGAVLGAEIERPQTPPGIHATDPCGEVIDPETTDQAASEEEGAAEEEDDEMATTAERVQEMALAQVELRGRQDLLAARLDHVAEKVEGIDARGERLEEGQRRQGEQLAGCVEATGRIPAIVEAQTAQAQKMDRVLVLLEGVSGIVSTGGPQDLARVAGGAAGGGPLGAALGLALKALGPTGTLAVIIYLLWSGKISL